ncbi:YhbY family RNA-binding protein [Agrilactobacillus fermenti]|uniref:YhbY family RNA-binding protein n=1 Tax=Agrilactobacillus fermenti TaxID=2586909 RepID=UPI001E319F5C|nr:YhbY family RNA-binding protein [Agrilactobacillus fermenti]MCD2256674.1 YhbY family RNA-binding protein [Agrilactobacillus fermenti]
MLTGKQKRFLRSKGQTMRPIMQIGKNEFSQHLFAQVDATLERRELIKISLLQAAAVTPQDTAEWLVAQDHKIEIAQIIGRTILVFRPSTKEKFQDISKSIAEL